MQSRPGFWALRGLSIFVLLCAVVLVALPVRAAPYAALVMDARTGEVLHSRNADTRLHPASLTKMMTLYVAFQAIEHGEISLTTKVKISKTAAAEPPSKLGLKSGQRIEFRYLIRAAAIKSANDAATAIGEAISGSEAAFARRMNRTAKAIGMGRTTFKNAHGLTESGHLSTARDMTLLGRRLFYDYPKYYNLFSRKTTDAGVRSVANTNRRFLNAYRGADGIKTGYTRAAGFNLTASAERGQERIIATVFGGRSSAWRNQRMGELMDMGFQRAPSKARVRKPKALSYTAPSKTIVPASRQTDAPGTAGKTIRLVRAPKKSIRPVARPIAEPAPEALVAMASEIDAAVAEVGAEAQAPASEETDAVVVAALTEEAIQSVAKPAPKPKADDPALVKTALNTAALDAESEAKADANAKAEAEAKAAAEQQAALAALSRVRPKARVLPEPAKPVEVAVAPESAPAPAKPEVVEAPKPAPKPEPAPVRLAVAAPARPADLMPEVVEVTRTAPRDDTAEGIALEVVTRMSTSGGQGWGINVGRYNSRYQAERVLLKTALLEIETLDDALRKVVPGRAGHEANFVGMSEFDATLACRRLSARGVECETISPTG